MAGTVRWNQELVMHMWAAPLIRIADLEPTCPRETARRLQATSLANPEELCPA
jgi:hypothetical protein